MKLNQNFITHASKGEHYMISTGNAEFKGIVKNNETASFIIECLKTETTEMEIVEKLLKKYTGTNIETIEKDVNCIIEKLRSIGALEE